VRRVYFLSRDEEGERTLDAILAQGLDPECIENPKCPRCFSPLIPAYVEDDEFTVVTWYELGDEVSSAESWFLVCQNLECQYEEQIERTLEPEGAEFFDVHDSHWSFEEECGLDGSNGVEQLEVIAYLKEVVRQYPYRRNESLLQAAEWAYDDMITQHRSWASRRQTGQRIRFCLEPDHIDGIFFAATEKAMMLQVEPEGHLITVEFERINRGTCRVRPPERKPKPPAPGEISERVIICPPSHERVVIGGHHLVLSDISRFGIYRVRCWDAKAAADLGLTQIAENYWEGDFRRGQLDAHYEFREMVRVKGHWVEAGGRTPSGKGRSIRTQDQAIAAALGLERREPWPDEDGHVPPDHQPVWTGIIRVEEIEAEEEVRHYLWPRSDEPVSGNRQE